MKHVLDLSKQHQSFIDYITHLPHNILKHHDRNDLSHLALYHLANDASFAFKRAAYFVDNPDFDHFVGVAGFCDDQCKFNDEDVWKNPAHFGSLITQTPFNNEVKTIYQTSFKKKHLDFSNTAEIKDLGTKLGMPQCDFITMDIKHGNHGLLIFEHKKQLDAWHKKILSNIAPVLGFCPVF